MFELKNYADLAHKGVDGERGACFELALKDFYGLEPIVSGQLEIDIRIDVDGTTKNGNKCEVKTGAGQLLHNCKGNKYIIYCPLPEMDLSLERQEAFIMRRTEFIKMLKEIGGYRESKTTTAGTKTEAIQTFWNGKLNKPHGKLYERLLDALYERAMPLQEVLERA